MFSGGHHFLNLFFNLFQQKAADRSYWDVIRIYVEQAIGRLKDFRIIETPAVFITFASNEKYNVCLCCIDKFKEASGFLKLAAYVFYKKHFYKKMSLKNPKTSQNC